MISQNNKLKKVLNPNKFRFVVVLYDTTNDIDKIKSFIKEQYPDTSSKTLKFEDKKYADLANTLYNDNSFVYIEKFSDMLENKELYSAFNQRRDKLASYAINLVAFYPKKLQTKLYQDASNFIPDLWEFRSAVIELESRKKEIPKEVKKEHTLYKYSGMNEQEKRQEIKRLQKRVKSVTADELKVPFYTNMGFLYQELGEYKKAQPLFEKSLKIREMILGEDHSDTAESYYNLALLYFDLQNYQEAYTYMKKAIKIWQQVLPGLHPNLISSKKGLRLIQEKLN